ncbi:hypothetical protein Agub_g1579 [Astrephomene gubernaculifera]|uniref:Tyrosine specific protein phosphatases domain-containing protein n=1 Tax=Astrephomene gubernaculifera TaxID=47775 RepID=A0AAD3HHK4_9CHLO|nr:hypothetical protein Agub_g1579 [Astrephomene gubernaculifera]
MRRNLDPNIGDKGLRGRDIRIPTVAESPRTVTSANQPIDVSWIPPCEGASGGRLGLTYCPGKHITARNGVQYARDLRADLSRLKQEHGVHVIVCLLPDAELRYLRVRDYAAAVAAHHMTYMQLPIIEMAPPDDMQRACALVEGVVEQLQAGRTVVVHCKGGVGRAGLLAACVLIRLGVCGSAQEAIDTVRRYRRGAVESRKQEDFVGAFWRLRAGRDKDVKEA